ncbi:uncharacterized protein LOC108925120 isoform X2 [Scleropages formosus]|uniref:uncharacterized protein LOC108925120 isoform X2 n=1 Tax=Scleropages formosus TaxID=113540 RepID=UPI00087916CC|nr:uncharacterized protein LOC108925120 isoform X2 [Scleropages formosus]
MSASANARQFGSTFVQEESYEKKEEEELLGRKDEGSSIRTAKQKGAPSSTAGSSGTGQTTVHNGAQSDGESFLHAKDLNTHCFSLLDEIIPLVSFICP